MKHIILAVIVALAATVSVFAQTEPQKTSSDDEMKTLFGKGAPLKLGWFVGIDPGYTQFDGRSVWMGGISAGLILNRNFALGLTGRAWVNRNGMFYPNVTDTAGAYLDGGYGGLLVEYTLFPKSMVHVTFPVIIGGGWATYVTALEYYEWKGGEMDLCHKTIGSDAFFVVEPGIRVEINLQKFMRLNAGVSYRYVGDLQLINTPSTMMNNFTATIGLKFGKF
ncbi:MAG: hypothetical protein WCK84_13270 [Bacteroidota bacterium]